MMGQSETLRSSQIIFSTLFFEGKHWAEPLTSHCKECTYAEPKPFFLIQTGTFFDFSSSNCTEHPWRCSNVPQQLGGRLFCQGTICYLQISTRQNWGGQVWISWWTVQADQRLLYWSYSTPTSHVKHVCCVTLKMSSQKQRIFFYSEHCRSQHGHYHWQQHRRSATVNQHPPGHCMHVIYSLVDEPQLS
jgi:hypothetical protein